MNVLITENEKPAVDGLVRLLQIIDPAIHVVGVTDSVESTMNWLQTHRPPDLLLMDIQLDDGLCFELFETVNIEIPVIFTTAYDEYMLSAFKVNSVDYLLKPIGEESLRRAIEKFRSFHYHPPEKSEVFKQLLQSLNKGYKNRFLIKVGERYKSVPDTEIACIYILERATFLRTSSEKDYPIDYTLEALQKSLDPGRFFRINRNCMVNINEISDILHYSSSLLKITLKGNKPVPDLIVSKDKVSEFKRWIDK